MTRIGYDWPLTQIGPNGTDPPLAALLLYFSTVDSGAAPRVGRYRRRTSKEGHRWSHWIAISAAIVCAWLAALSKEIGIAVLGTMMIYDLLLVPLEPTAFVIKEKHEEAEDCIAGTGHPMAAMDTDKPSRISSFIRQPKWRRMAMLGLSGILYVKARAFVAGDQLVRIYRKVSGTSRGCPGAVINTKGRNAAMPKPVRRGSARSQGNKCSD